MLLKTIMRINVRSQLIYCLLVSSIFSQNRVKDENFLSNWMSHLMPAIGNLTLMDISLPGTHDSMSYDLSTTVSVGANDLPSWLSFLLHDYYKAFNIVGKFIQQQARTQTLNATAQLDSGIRFIDFRAMFTPGPTVPSKGTKAWYSIHMVETYNKVEFYLSSIRAWLDSHPNEILVIWVSYHGGVCSVGQDQYPGVPVEAKKLMWTIFESTFAGQLFDTKLSQTNETTLNELISRNHRIIALFSDYSETTGNSTLAQDACTFFNNQGGSHIRQDSFDEMIDRFGDWKNTKPDAKMANKFYLQSFAADGTDYTSAFFLTYFSNFLTNWMFKQKCAKSYDIPGVANWCPLSLFESAKLNNYYHQFLFEAVISNQNLNFPNAFYIDAVTQGGLINYGVGKESIGYAYVDTLILYNLRLVCDKTPIQETIAACNELIELISERRSLNPLKPINDPERGRITGWPLIKNLTMS